MGKRKMHGQVFYQCDWTAFPMLASNAYMPTWTTGKLTKRGSYYNWEAVLAHAHHMHDVEKVLETSELDRITQHVTEHTGCLPDYRQFHFSFLEHFKTDDEKWMQVDKVERNWCAEDFHNACCLSNTDITAVKISPDGAVFDIIMKVGELVKSYLTCPYMYTSDEHSPSQFQSMRKGKIPKDRDLTVFYWPGKNGLEHNTTASSIFKVAIYGDVLLVQETKEASAKPRNRFINFNKQMFDDLFHKKRKKPTATCGMTKKEFDSVKAEMQSSLNGCEASISEGASRPQDLAAGAKMPPSAGFELKEVAELLGNVQPEKKKKLEDRMTLPSLVEVRG